MPMLFTVLQAASLVSELFASIPPGTTSIIGMCAAPSESQSAQTAPEGPAQ